MNARDFCFWLQGYFELADAGLDPATGFSLSREQVDMIRTHLGYVFEGPMDAPPVVSPPPTTKWVDAEPAVVSQGQKFTETIFQC